jgi:hypothetical protein
MAILSFYFHHHFSTWTEEYKKKTGFKTHYGFQYLINPAGTDERPDNYLTSTLRPGGEF